MSRWAYETGPWMPTRAVRGLLTAMVAVYVLQVLLELLFGWNLETLFGLSLLGVKRLHVWQFVTYLFVHGGVMHLLINVLTLVFMGPETERALGTRQFLALFLVSGVLGGMGWLIISDTPWAVCVGASGALFGIIGAFAALFPNQPITLLLFFVLPITLRAWVLALALGLIELAFLLRPDGGHVAYAAHLSGGVAGYVYAWVLFRRGGGTAARVRSAVEGMGRRVADAVGRGPGARQEELDRILDKVSRDGIGSLTRSERSFLERESRERRERP